MFALTAPKAKQPRRFVYRCSDCYNKARNPADETRGCFQALCGAEHSEAGLTRMVFPGKPTAQRLPPKVTTADMVSLSCALRRSTTPAPWRVALHALLPQFGGPPPLALPLVVPPPCQGHAHFNVPQSPAGTSRSQTLLPPSVYPPRGQPSPQPCSATGQTRCHLL